MRQYYDDEWIKEEKSGAWGSGCLWGFFVGFILGILTLFTAVKVALGR